MTDVLQVKEVDKSFAGTQAVKSVSFHMKSGEIGCLLGPSGCGKTTLLRLIAGLESLDKGHLELGGLILDANGNSLAPEARGVGMVFQDYALFPHLTVGRNISFGLSRNNRHAQRQKVTAMLELVGLQGMQDRYPHELSGGQQQRVALAPSPRLLLLDEPFSSLDGSMRERLSLEVRDILKSQGIPGLMVTHSQEEAFGLADMIGVMNQGELQQWGSAQEIYHRPNNPWVAAFVGEGAMLRGRVEPDRAIACALGRISQDPVPGRTTPQPGHEVALFLRPEDVVHEETGGVPAKVVRVHFRGATLLYELELDNQERLFCLSTSHHEHKPGEWISIKTRIQDLVLFPWQGENQHLL